MTDRTPLDLTSCDREPIHIPGSIQPFGYLLAVDAAGRVVYASANLPEILDREVSSILDHPLSELIGFELQSLPPQLAFGDRVFDISIRQSGAVVIVEFEPTGHVELDIVLESFRGITASETVREISEKAVSVVRHLCGFDRVMLYRFLPDGTGVVIAEDVRPDVDSYLGLHYPATDIPEQARAL